MGTEKRESVGQAQANSWLVCERKVSDANRPVSRCRTANSRLNAPLWPTAASLKTSRFHPASAAANTIPLSNQTPTHLCHADTSADGPVVGHVLDVCLPIACNLVCEVQGPVEQQQLGAHLLHGALCLLDRTRANCDSTWTQRLSTCA